MRAVIFAIFLLQSGLSFSQSLGNGYISGPMIGYCEVREVLIWLEVNEGVNNAAIRYWEKGKIESVKVETYADVLGKEFNPLKFELKNLKPGTLYEYQIVLNKITLRFSYDLQFKTKELWQWRNPAPDFSFLAGTCVYINDKKYDRPGTPYGLSTNIFKTMARTNADFMIWGGDNTYLRESDWFSEHGIQYRYSHTRKEPNMQELLSVRPNYAIWDDHDYGPNNSNASYDFKYKTFQTFTDYWGNANYGPYDEDVDGIYSKFEWSDCEFYLMDNRFNRSPNELPATSNNQFNQSKKYLGDIQLEWLKYSLLTSSATFKFIVGGNQWLNENNDGECFRHYPYEFNELVNFIKQQKITGIIFVSGDRHFSELIKVDLVGLYTLYDITCSPLTSTPKNISDSKEFNNPLRVPGKLLMETNYIKFKVSGKLSGRQVEIECFDAKGILKWDFSLNENDLDFEF